MTTYAIVYHGQSYGGFGSMTEATLVALTLWPCASWTIALEAPVKDEDERAVWLTPEARRAHQRHYNAMWLALVETMALL